MNYLRGTKVESFLTRARGKTTTFPLLWNKTNTTQSNPNMLIAQNSKIPSLMLIRKDSDYCTAWLKYVEENYIYTHSSNNKSLMHNNFFFGENKVAISWYWRLFFQIIFKKADFRQHTIVFSLLLYILRVCVFISLGEGSGFVLVQKKASLNMRRLLRRRCCTQYEKFTFGWLTLHWD